MKIRLEPYKTWSGGAKALGKRCGILRATNAQVGKHGDFDVIINWGRNEKRFNGTYINKPDAVIRATDKLQTNERLRAEGVPVLDFTPDRAAAKQWLEGGDHVVVRKLLRGSSGRGIVLVGPATSEITSIHELCDAPLYTKYYKKAEEFRVHVAFGQVIDAQQKKRDTGVADENVNWQIRNAHNGWIFARVGVVVPDCVRAAAISAVTALGLDFGAVDLGYNVKNAACVVFEVNTAPGLEGQTLESYANAFTGRFPELAGGMYRKRREGLVKRGQFK